MTNLFWICLPAVGREFGDWILNEFWFLEMEVCVLFEGIGYP